MKDKRLTRHLILDLSDKNRISFSWRGEKLYAHKGEVITSALIANGIEIFGRHTKDNLPLGIFCANGQCSQCMVMADGIPVKGCMTPIRKGMQIFPCNELPALPASDEDQEFTNVKEVRTDVLVLGGGPAGLSGAIELGKLGVKTLLLDDKHKLGGKLVLQTHKFFGSVDDCRAGTRGIDIGDQLAKELEAFPSVKVWLETTALAVYSDRRVGTVKKGRYYNILPKAILVATGAREKYLLFPGNALPGVYGAGAFQTLVNRDGIRPTERLFVVGGGNVGLIAAYHALQADIQVVGLCELLPKCGGYKVHGDKIARLGVPIYTSHTLMKAEGKDHLESVTIVQVDDKFQPIEGTEKSFHVDTLLIAVGLTPVSEFLGEAEEAGIPAVAAGDADEIAEASSAMFTGKIAGLRIAKKLGRDVPEVPREWEEKADILKSPPGREVLPVAPEERSGVFPVFHCSQEIPCNPCITVCKKGGIEIEGDALLGIPRFVGECTGCERCIAICPGLALTLVDFRKDSENPTITIPFEINRGVLEAGDRVSVTDYEGNIIGEGEVLRIKDQKANNRTLHVQVRAPKEIAARIAGIRMQSDSITRPEKWEVPEALSDDAVACRCEHVTVGEIRELIRKGIRDLNHLKAITRSGMGACGGKGCRVIIPRIFRDEGVSPEEITGFVERPLFVEVPFGVFAGAKNRAKKSE